MILNKNEIGVTETYDPSFDYSWVDNLRPVNIIITKSLTNKMIDTLLTEECMKTCIVHLTVTGWGHSYVEPGVGNTVWSREQYDKLIKSGFSPLRVILRVDPIIPTDKGIVAASMVFKTFEDTPINTVRVSILDMYKHVLERYTLKGLTPPYDTFHAPRDMMYKVDELLRSWKRRYDFVGCAERYLKNVRQVGCVSEEDIKLIPDSKVTIEGNGNFRKYCLCPSNKVNIIRRKPSRCPFKCIYCFWKD